MTDGTKKMDRKSVLKVELALKRQEHGDLSVAIDAIQESRVPDRLVLQRLKRNKLALKDEIARLEDEITPDIIA